MSPPSHPEPLSGNNTTPEPRRKALAFSLETHPEASSAIQVAQKLNDAGFEAYLAGGAVRDLILGRTPKDFDIATNAKPEKVLELFKNTRKVGIAFGVVLVADYKPTIEVATFRTDVSYSDGRHPDQVIFSTAAEDALRRDFTGNGLFYDISRNEVVDYVGGLGDLEKKVLRAIGSAPDRFAEDYLRMLRAIRFAVTLNFEIEPETWSALQQYAKHIQEIAKDRIHEELRRTFAQGRSDLALILLEQSHLLKHCIPNHSEGWARLGRDHDTGGTLPVILALCLQNLPRQTELEQRLNEMRCSNPEKKLTHALIRSKTALQNYRQLSLSEKKRCLRQFDPEELVYFIERCPDLEASRDDIQQDLQQWCEQDYFPEHMLQGKDLLASGFPKGPEMGKVLKELETEILNEQLNSKQQVDTWLHDKVKKKSSPQKSK